MSAHTPMPWSLDSERYILAQHNSTVARVAILADGLFIVEAVNSHEALKARIQELEAELVGCRACRENIDCISRDGLTREQAEDLTRRNT